MNRVEFVLKGRGFQNALHRARLIKNRFGLNPSGFMRQIKGFSRLTAKYGIRPSFPISTILIERYPSISRELAQLPLDLLCHAYTHIDYAGIPKIKQDHLIEKSKALLSREGFKTDGFRAPYLHWNDDLLSSVANHGFSFDSSMAYWSLPSSSFSLSSEKMMALDQAHRFYEPFFAQADSGSHPYFLSNGLLEIPVTVPDDEILIDRLDITDPNKLTEILLQVFDHTDEKEGLFNMQLHPERISAMETSLGNLLQASRLRSPSVWLTTLREINQWWRNKDSFRVTPEILDKGILLRFNDVEEFTVLLKSTELIKDTVLWKPPFYRIQQKEIFIPGKHVPMIGLKGEGEKMKPQLKNMGYVTERADGATQFSLVFSRQLSSDETIKAIEGCSHPLLRVGPWPNGNSSALSISGDIDCLTLQDFIWRFTEAN